jgi:hypothetical protein
MDISELQVAVFRKTGIRLDRTDPVFALVALNEVAIAELFSTVQGQWAECSSELDAKIGALVQINDQILMASKELSTRVNQAHMAAALTAAAEAKTEIFKAARDAISVEVGKSDSIITEAAAKVDADRKRARFDGWGIAIVQAIISGMVAGIIILVAMLYK